MDADILGPSSSSSSFPSTDQPKCAICQTNPSRYTCPRCSLKSCSAACANAHKTRGKGCSGVRNKASYVPMNQYSWGTMMDDFSFLEDLGRKVEEVGEGIVKSGLLRGGAAGADSHGGRGGRGRGGGRGRVRGRGRGGRGVEGGSRKDLLDIQLGFKRISVDFLPEGMERAKVNQSRWDAKTNVVHLTLELVFHSHAVSSTSSPPYKCLLHRVNIDTPLFKIIQDQAPQITKRNTNATTSPHDPPSPPAYVTEILDQISTLPSTSASTSPLYLLPHYPSLGNGKPNPYHPLDPSQPLATLLRDRSFLEFPTVEIFPSRSVFTGRFWSVSDELEAGDESNLQDQGWEGKRKRRRIEEAEEGMGTTVIAKQPPPPGMDTLLGGYASSDDGDGLDEDDVDMDKEGEALQPKQGVGLLAGYETGEESSAGAEVEDDEDEDEEDSDSNEQVDNS